MKRSARAVVLSLDRLELVAVSGLLDRRRGRFPARRAAFRQYRCRVPVSWSRSRTEYGPNHYSEREEEWLIRDYFADRRGGVFVDVGANHYQDASKTYYLETNLAWSGIAVEPQ